MPALNSTELVQFQDRTPRVQSATVRPARLLLMLHGWTGDENSMWVFARDLPDDRWIIAPRAPFPTQPSGYSWLEYREGERGRHTLEALRPAIEALLRLVDDYAADNQIDARSFDLIGFSQGGALAALLALLHPDRVRKLAVLASFLPRGTEQVIARRPLEGKKVFVAHGTQDVMVPVDRARASIDLLEQAGAQVTYCEDEVGHKVSVNCLRALNSYLKD